MIRSKEEGRVYDRRRWRVLSRKKLTADPICEYCGNELATDVDHVIPIEDGGDPWAWENLSSLCSPCHGQKTNRELRARAW
jgi:5-methylcytosine-specific restriction protein A